MPEWLLYCQLSLLTYRYIICPYPAEFSLTFNISVAWNIFIGVIFVSVGARGGSVPMVTVQQTQQPATLFGGTPVRSQVACQVQYI